MPTEHKIQQVADLEDRLGRSTIAITMDYRGLSAGQMQELRRTLREIEPTTELRVVKNTLLRRAADNSGKSGLMDVVEEATALIFGYTDEVSAAKGLAKFASDSRLELAVRGGFMDGAVLDKAQIDELAKIPSRVELMAKLAGSLNSPITGIAGGISSLIREVAAVIEARAAQLEAEAPATDAPTTDTAASETAADDAAADEEADEAATDTTDAPDAASAGEASGDTAPSDDDDDTGSDGDTPSEAESSAEATE